MKKLKISICIMLVIALISGCGTEKPLQKLDEKATGKLKVFYSQGNHAFQENYGKLFNVKYPNIELEVIDQSEVDMDGVKWGSDKHKQQLKQLIAKHQPDVMLLEQDLFAELAQNNKLYSLDTLMIQDNFDIKGYMDGYMEMIKQLGKGNIYGLAPVFYPMVLYYNASLFKEHKVAPPNNKMTWQEIVAIAKRFTGGTGKNKIYGLEQRDGSGVEGLVLAVGETLGLRLLDEKEETLLIHSAGWKQAFQLVADAVRSKAVYVGDKTPDGQIVHDMWGKFLQGKAAMVMESSGYVNQITQSKNEVGIKEKDLNWDMVTVPIHSASPHESAFIRMGDFWAIGANSTNLNVAWQFVSFFNSPEKAKSDAKIMGYDGIPTRKQVSKEIDGKNKEVFYLLQPKESKLIKSLMVDLPNDFMDSYMKLVGEAIQSMVDNKKTVDEAMMELQHKGQAALIKARLKEKVRKEKEQVKNKAS